MSQGGALSATSSPSVAVQYDADTGSATPAANILNLLGGTGLSTTAAGNTVTFDLDTPVDETLGGTGQTTFATGDILYASAANTLSKLAIGSAGEVLTVVAGIPSWEPDGGGTVTSVSGTAGRITSTGGATPVIDIDATYVGQNSITTLGTVTTGTWNGTAVGETFGGTGQSTYATGDILYASAANTLSKLAAGTNTHVLTLAAGVPTWAAPSSGGIPTIGSSTDNALVRWDGAGGTAVQNGVITEDDTGNLSQSASVAGASLSVTTANTSNTASATAFHNVQVAGSTASDAYYKAEISGGQAWTWGLDNSDSDAWVLSGSSTPGTTNVMRVATSGEINYPLQSAFMAYMNTAVTNVTGDGTVYTVIFDTEVFDQNSDFNLGTSTFTAPVTGRYHISYSCGITGATSITSSTLTAVTSNRSYTNPMPAAAGAVTSCSGNINVLADFDSGDTCTLEVVTTDTGGKIDDVNGLVSSKLRTWVSIYLEC